jgi:hypothetical protein
MCCKILFFLNSQLINLTRSIDDIHYTFMCTSMYWSAECVLWCTAAIYNIDNSLSASISCWIELTFFRPHVWAKYKYARKRSWIAQEIYDKQFHPISSIVVAFANLMHVHCICYIRSTIFFFQENRKYTSLVAFQKSRRLQSAYHFQLAHTLISFRSHFTMKPYNSLFQ